MRMLCIFNWSVRPYNIFEHYLINGTIFEKKNLLNIKYVFWFSVQILSETFLILRRNERDIILNVHMSLCKVPVILVRFYWNLNFLHSFSKNIPISYVMKIRPVEAELFYADRWKEERTDRRTDGQTDRHDEANSRFSQLCKRA